MDEKPSNDPYANIEAFRKQLRAQHLKLRNIIREILEEETGEVIKMEDDLSAILKKLPKDRQEAVANKVKLAQMFPDQA